MVTSYIALDLETTGLEPKLEKITEIALLKVIDGQIADRFVTLVNPGRRLGDFITGLTGITDEMVAGAPRIEDVIGEALDFIGDLPVIGHHVIFDYSFLKRAAVNAGRELSCEGVDTLALCRLFMPAGEKHTLGDACAYFHVPQSCAHRAEADAESAHLLYQELMTRFGGEAGEKFAAKPLIYKAKREQPATKRQKEYLQDLVKCHRIDLTVQLDAISRSEASRLIDRIILEHGRLPWKRQNGAER